MMRRMFTWVLVLTVLLCLPLLAAAETPASDFLWEANDDGGVTITGYTGNGGDVVIPAQIDGKPVTAIGDAAFEFCDSLTSVVLPDSVTSIGEDAFFRCYNVTSVTIPDSVTSIGPSAFRECAGLTSVILPMHVASVGDHAFEQCENLTSVAIQNPNTQLGSYVFLGSPLQELVLPENGRYVLTSSGLLADTAGESGVTIAGYFGQDTALEIPEQINGQPVTTIGRAAFVNCSSLISVTLPISVTSIGEDAFSGCRGLTSVTFSDNVTSIGEFAFASCSSLTSIVLPDSVTFIGHDAFFNCSSLTEINASEAVLRLMETSGFELP